MQEITIQSAVDAPIEQVWRVIADYGNVAVWNPNIKASRIIGEQAQGVGALRQCDLSDGKNYVQERITAWEEGKSLSLDVVDGTMPFEHAEFEVELEAAGSSQTKVHMKMRFKPKGGALGKVAAVVMIKPMMRRLFGKIAGGLKAHVEGAAQTPAHAVA